MFGYCPRLNEIKNYASSRLLGSWYTTELHDAVKAEDLTKIKKLIKAGIYIDTRNDDHDMGCSVPIAKTPLHLAVQRGYFEIVKYLLENGADVNNASGEFATRASWLAWHLTPLEYALFFNRIEIANYLIRFYNASFDENDEKKILKMVDDNGLINSISFLQEHIKDKSLLNKSYIESVHKNHYLVQENSLWKRQNNESWCEDTLRSYPLDERSIQSHLQTIILCQNKSFLRDLLQLDYFTHHFNKYNEFIFELDFREMSNEMKANHSDICYRLQNNGIDTFECHGMDCELIYRPNTNKLPILFVGILAGDAEIVKMLIDKGADINAVVNGISASDLIKQVFPKSDCIVDESNRSLCKM